MASRTSPPARRNSAYRAGVALIRLAARLHDIGKIAIPDAILDKPGPLDEREWEFVHRHTLIGERIVAAPPSLIPRSAHPLHHERVDGNGYPDGLNGEDIPLGSASSPSATPSTQ